MPHLRELVKLHDADDFVLIGINVGDDEKAFRDGCEKFGVTWPVAYAADDVAKTYRVSAFPTIYVLDAEGRIRGTNLRGERLVRFVGELLDQEEGAPR